MMKWSILPEAQAEYEQALQYYFAIDADIAANFDRHFVRHRAMIVEYPFIHSLHRYAVRYAHLGPQFADSYIAYIVRESDIVIIAVAHTKRRPSDWRDRAESPEVR